MKKLNPNSAPQPAARANKTPDSTADLAAPRSALAGLKKANDSQSIHRAFSLLRTVAQSRSEGIRLTDIAEAADLHVATAHRLLAALVRERFVTLDPYTRLYYVGSELLLMAEGAREYRIKRHFRDVLAKLARDTEDTVYLSTPSGNDAVCIDRVEGQYPIRTLTLDIGARRPLGIGGGSLALLAWLPTERVESVLEACAERYRQYKDMSDDEVRMLVRATRRQGFSFNAGRIIDGVCAVGVPVLDGDGRPIASISVAAIAPRMTPKRRRFVAEAIKVAIAGAGLPPAPD